MGSVDAGRGCYTFFSAQIAIPRLQCTPIARKSAHVCAAQARHERIAFVNVTIVPMDQERVLPGQTVVVEGKRIAQTGPASAIKLPAGCPVFRCTLSCKASCRRV